jgi:hypothetical protein
MKLSRLPNMKKKFMVDDLLARIETGLRLSIGAELLEIEGELEVNKK